MEFERRKGDVEVVFRGTAEEYAVVFQVHSQPAAVDPIELLFRDTAWIVAARMDSTQRTLPTGQHALPTRDLFALQHDPDYRLLQGADHAQGAILNQAARLEASRQPTSMTAQLAPAVLQRRRLDYANLILLLLIVATLGLTWAAVQYKRQHMKVGGETSTPAKTTPTGNTFNPNWNPFPVIDPPKGRG